MARGGNRHRPRRRGLTGLSLAALIAVAVGIGGAPRATAVPPVTVDTDDGAVDAAWASVPLHVDEPVRDLQVPATTDIVRAQVGWDRTFLHLRVDVHEAPWGGPFNPNFVPMIDWTLDCDGDGTAETTIRYTTEDTLAWFTPTDGRNLPASWAEIVGATAEMRVERADLGESCMQALTVRGFHLFFDNNQRPPDDEAEGRPVFLPAELGDYVWFDTDRDGLQDPAEAPVPGIDVQLLDAGGAVTATTTTDGSGRYRFDDLLPDDLVDAETVGDVRIRFLLPPDLVPTTPDAGDDALDSDASVATDGTTVETTLEFGESDLTWDLGLVEQAPEEPPPPNVPPPIRTRPPFTG